MRGATVTSRVDVVSTLYALGRTSSTISASRAWDALASIWVCECHCRTTDTVFCVLDQRDAAQRALLTLTIIVDKIAFLACRNTMVTRLSQVLYTRCTSDITAFRITAWRAVNTSFNSLAVVFVIQACEAFLLIYRKLARRAWGAYRRVNQNMLVVTLLYTRIRAVQVLLDQSIACNALCVILVRVLASRAGNA